MVSRSGHEWAPRPTVRNAEEPGVWLTGGGPFKAFDPWGSNSEKVVIRA